LPAGVGLLGDLPDASSISINEERRPPFVALRGARVGRRPCHSSNVTCSRELSPSRMSELQDRAYWLRNCGGFRVYQNGRKVGIVTDCLLDHGTREAASLLISSGLFRLTSRVLAVSAVAHIDAAAMRIELSPGERHQTR
jgi:hypothetical protein